MCPLEPQVSERSVIFPGRGGREQTGRSGIESTCEGAGWVRLGHEAAMVDGSRTAHGDSQPACYFSDYVFILTRGCSKYSLSFNVTGLSSVGVLCILYKE